MSLQVMHSVAAGPTQEAQSGWEQRYWMIRYYLRPQLAEAAFALKLTLTLGVLSVNS